MTVIRELDITVKMTLRSYSAKDLDMAQRILEHKIRFALPKREVRHDGDTVAQVVKRAQITMPAALTTQT